MSASTIYFDNITGGNATKVPIVGSTVRHEKHGIGKVTSLSHRSDSYKDGYTPAHTQVTVKWDISESYVKANELQVVVLDWMKKGQKVMTQDWGAGVIGRVAHATPERPNSTVLVLLCDNTANVYPIASLKPILATLDELVTVSNQ